MSWHFEHTIQLQLKPVTYSFGKIYSLSGLICLYKSDLTPAIKDRTNIKRIHLSRSPLIGIVLYIPCCSIIYHTSTTCSMPTASISIMANCVILSLRGKYSIRQAIYYCNDFCILFQTANSHTVAYVNTSSLWRLHGSAISFRFLEINVTDHI